MHLNYVSPHITYGQCYHYDRGVEHSLRAFKTFQAGLTEKDLKVLVILGDCYRYGFGVESIYDTVSDYYKRTADQYNAVAHLLIEDCDSESISMNLDPEMARFWPNAAAERGEPQYFFPPSSRYARILGVLKRKLISFKYLRSALMHALVMW